MMPRFIGLMAATLMTASSLASAAQANCPTASQLTHAHMKGDWQVVWQEQGRASAPPETVRFGPNPEFPDSLSGELLRGKQRVQLAGDVEDGQLTLEESPDGKSISATWTGQVQAGSCGTAVTGQWTRDAGSPMAERQGPAQRQFLLRRSAGW
jgi:hypothetical protein